MALVPALAGCAHFDSGPNPGIASSSKVPRTFRSIGATSTRPAVGPLPAPESSPPLVQPVGLTRSTAPPPGAADPRNRPVPSLPDVPFPAPAAVADAPRPIVAPLPLPAPPPTANDLGPSAIIAEARQAVDGLSQYRVRLQRQERVGNRLHDPEEVLLSIRRQPVGVRIEWPQGANKGREVLYQAGEGPDVMHVNMPGALVPRITLPVNSPLALKNSRHPIQEAGFESIVTVMESWVAETPDRVRFEGMVTPEGGDRPARKVVFQSPEGETRIVHLDARSHLPVAVHVTAANGDLLEDYRFLDLHADCPELASNDAFDPAKRWGPPRGLLSKRNEERTAQPPTQ